MPDVLLVAPQTRWKDSYASSVRCQCTLRANGEEPVMVFTNNGTLVQAGFDAPTAAPTCAITAAGTGHIAAGYVAYYYVYASSQYPNVEAIITAGGETWPRSNPSPVSATFHVTPTNSSVNVTVTQTTRSDVDYILIYRTLTQTTAAEATAQGLAGNAYYVGRVTNDGVGITKVFLDDVADPTSTEQLELDNYVAPEFWVTVFDGKQWWGIGNPDLNVAVTITLNVTSVIMATDGAATFYSGRNGQIVTFDGVTFGGFDGKGSYYFKQVSTTQAAVSLTPTGGATSIGATGTTTMRVHGFAGTLYRSKVQNPFAWGFTEYQVSGEDVLRVPQTYAFPVGGYAVAMAVMPENFLLKIDVERPNTTYVLNLQLAGRDGFENTLRKISTQFTVSSHHSQFEALLPNGGGALRGLDCWNTNVLQSDGGSQGPVDDPIYQTINLMDKSNELPRWYHGVFDPFTKLSCFWFKISDDPNDLLTIDTCAMYHGDSNQWSIMRDFDITASASVFDPVTLTTVILVGTATGQIAHAFVPDTFGNFYSADGPSSVNPLGGSSTYNLDFSGLGIVPDNASYFDLPNIEQLIRFFFSYNSAPPTAPAAPTNGIAVRVPINGAGTLNAAMQQLVVAATANGFSGNATVAGANLTVNLPGPPPSDYDNGTFSDVELVIIESPGDYELAFTFDDFQAGHWALITKSDGSTPQYIRISGVDVNTGLRGIDVTYNVDTNTASQNITVSMGVEPLIYTGLIECEARTYFQKNQTESQQPREIWGTFENTGYDADVNPYGLFYRIYQEFDTDPINSTAIVPTQTETSNEASSMNWVARDVPTPLAPQLGYSFTNRAWTDFQMLGFQFKEANAR